jgi:hypothetical protein
MKKVLLFISILYSYSVVCYGQQKTSDCIYDSTAITSDFIKNISTEKYEWNNNLKEAKIITKQGDFLYIKKWACVTQGTVARLMIIGEYEPIDKNFLKWKNKILSTASEILDKKNYEELKKYLLDESLVAERFGTDLVFNVKSTTQQKFIVVISPLDKLVIINYLLYK